MRKYGNYRRVYWGGAALAFDLDVRIRSASNNRRSLDDLMLALWPLAPEHRRFAAADLLARMDEEVARWHRAGELEHEISPSAIAAMHLRAKATPDEVQHLRGIAVEVQSRRVRLLANPKDEVEVRTSLFGPKIVEARDSE
jgi:predicted metalloprotease with PDZ domain